MHFKFAPLSFIDLTMHAFITRSSQFVQSPPLSLFFQLRIILCTYHPLTTHTFHTSEPLQNFQFHSNTQNIKNNKSLVNMYKYRYKNYQKFYTHCSLLLRNGKIVNDTDFQNFQQIFRTLLRII